MATVADSTVPPRDAHDGQPHRPALEGGDVREVVRQVREEAEGRPKREGFVQLRASIAGITAKKMIPAIDSR